MGEPTTTGYGRRSYPGRYVPDRKLHVFFAELDAGASLLRAAAVADISEHVARFTAESMGYCNVKRRVPDAE